MFSGARAKTQGPLHGNGTVPEGTEKAAEVMYEEYDPLVLRQREASPVLEFPTFDDALDEFYSKVPLCAAVQEKIDAILSCFDMSHQAGKEGGREGRGAMRRLCLAQTVANEEVR